MRAQGGVGGAVGQARSEGVGGGVDPGHHLCAEVVFGGEPERVVVAGHRLAQQQRGVGEFGGEGGGRALRLVAVQDRGEDVGGGRRDQGLGADHAVGVAVAGGGEVDVIRRCGRG